MAPAFSPSLRSTAILIAFLGLILHPAGGSAHGPIHDQIDQITRDIGSAPGYADLYLVRAGLYRLDQDWARAEADLAVAERLGSASSSIAMI